MDHKHRKRFTFPVPPKGGESKALLEDLLAKLPKLDEDKPFEKALSGLLKDSIGWLDVFKKPGSRSFAREKGPQASRRSAAASKAPGGEEIESLVDAGKIAKAKRAARQVLREVNVKEALAEEARSPEACGTVTVALRVLALIADTQGDKEKAAKAYRLLAKVYSSNAGRDAEETLQYKYSLAELYEDDEPEKAIDLLEEVIDSCERTGATGSAVYAAAKSLGAALRMYDEDSEELDKAAGYLSDAEALQAEEYESDPESWWQLATTIDRLAKLAQHREEYEEAKRHYQRAISLYRQHVDPEDGQDAFEFAVLLMQYGECLLENGEDSKAIRAGKESVEVVKRTFGPLSVEAIPFFLGLGQVYRETATPEGAEKACRMFKKVVVLHEQHFRSPEDYLAEAETLLEAHKGIIASYTTLRSYKKAEAWAMKALRVSADLDDDFIERHQIYKMLAFICESDGRPVEAQHYEGLARDFSESFGVPDDEDGGGDDDGEGETGEEDDDDGQWWRGGAQNDDNDE